MIKNLKIAFKSLVDNASIAKDKANYMVANIGYPDWMMNKTSLQNYYGKVTINSSFELSKWNYIIDDYYDTYMARKVIDF